ncbi:uncharacterized protein LOC134527403 [Bacillus rossius redtenbacheri]|uniref:uncharacterized protein LOC134527403 n=1 Tax=Bacillus rossius redtenbacheri TaxID=93214 RepID=UPI002FDDD645
MTTTDQASSRQDDVGGTWSVHTNKRVKRAHLDVPGASSEDEAGPSPSPLPPQPPAAPAKTPKVKPLFVFLDQGHQYPRVYTALKNALTDKFTCQNRGRDEIMVHTASVPEYHRAIKALEAIGAQHSVLLQHDEIPKKFVLRGIHRHTPLDFLQQEFTALSLPTCNSERIYGLTEFAGMRIRVDDYRRPSGPSQCSNCQRFTHSGKGCKANPVCRWCSGPHRAPDCPNGGNPEHKKCVSCKLQHCANYRGCAEFKKESRRHLPPQVRKAREQQSRRDMKANRQAAAGPPPQPQQQPGPSGNTGPPRQNPWGPRFPPPPTFGQYMAQAGANMFEPLQQHCEPGYDEMAYPAIANNPRPRGQWQQRGSKKHPTDHKNGKGKPRTTTEGQPQQQAQAQQPAAKTAPVAKPRATPKPVPPPAETPAEDNMLIDVVTVDPTEPLTPISSNQAPRLEDIQKVL